MTTLRRAGLVLLIAAASCSDATGPSRQLGGLAEARDRWHAQDLHTYALTVQRSCFCALTNPLYVVVVSDTVAGVINLETGQSVDRTFGITVDGLFGFIQDAIDKPAHLITAEYDAVKGFPTLIGYDGSAQVADDELTYHVSDVHVIRPDQ